MNSKTQDLIARLRAKPCAHINPPSIELEAASALEELAGPMNLNKIFKAVLTARRRDPQRPLHAVPGGDQARAAGCRRHALHAALEPGAHLRCLHVRGRRKRDREVPDHA